MDEKEVLSIKEIMSRLDISRVTAYKLIKTGQLHAIKVCGVWKIPAESYAEFLHRKMKRIFADMKTKNK